ncbi:LAFA_0D02080g1_1 [Lachancea sp. 'fantastica']|nr:LAFA_0D02080g1_1 [Lachancea sp. 'fantastica']
MPGIEAGGASRDATLTFQDSLYDQARAMSHLSVHYGSHNENIQELLEALVLVASSGRKLIFLGTGKSFKIVHKSVAMLTSLGIDARALHPSEALHGDMGAVRPGDALLVCSSSGETQELVTFLKHTKTVLEPSLTVLVSSSTHSTLHTLVDKVLYVPQPHGFRETTLQHGLPSPTISTTLMLSVLDSFCLALSELYYDGDVEQRLRFFKKMHPGGGIGKQLAVATVAEPLAVAHAMGPRPGFPSRNECYISCDVSEGLFLQYVVEFDYCVIEGVRYSSHVLQHWYRTWKRMSREQTHPKTALNGSWDLAWVLAPRSATEAV